MEKNCGNISIALMDATELKRNVICEEHFLPSQVNQNNKRKLLHKNAIPINYITSGKKYSSQKFDNPTVNKSNTNALITYSKKRRIEISESSDSDDTINDQVVLQQISEIKKSHRSEEPEIENSNDDLTASATPEVDSDVDIKDIKVDVIYSSDEEEEKEEPSAILVEEFDPLQLNVEIDLDKTVIIKPPTVADECENCKKRKVSAPVSKKNKASSDIKVKIIYSSVEELEASAATAALPIVESVLTRRVSEPIRILPTYARSAIRCMYPID